MYEFGGIYLDMDMVYVKPFDFSFFNTKQCKLIFLSKDIFYPLSLHNCFLASAPKQKFWIHLLDEIKYYQPSLVPTISINLNVLYHTGPFMVKNVYDDYMFKNQIKIIGKEYFINKSSESFTYHTYDGTWWNIKSIIRIILVTIIFCISLVYILSKK
jgi:mannosyltransferase OCH1-like enzyme